MWKKYHKSSNILSYLWHWHSPWYDSHLSGSQSFLRNLFHLIESRLKKYCGDEELGNGSWGFWASVNWPEILFETNNGSFNASSNVPYDLFYETLYELQVERDWEKTGAYSEKFFLMMIICICEVNDLILLLLLIWFFKISLNSVLVIDHRSVHIQLGIVLRLGLFQSWLFNPIDVIWAFFDSLNGTLVLLYNYYQISFLKN